MLDANEIRNQAYLDSREVTSQGAAELSRAEAWSPHVSDGLDALAKAMSEAELKTWSNVVAKAWSDDAFRQRLMQDAPSALREFGIEPPEAFELRVVESTDKVRYIALPQKQAGDATELSDAEARTIALGLMSTTPVSRLPQTWADTWVAITA